MKFEAYCDESRHDLLGSKNPDLKYMVIGSLWLAQENRERYKNEIHQLRDEYKIGGEFKWQKVSPSRLDFYKKILHWFQDKKDQLRFRCIAVDHNHVDISLYHENNKELGFYKFYYQLLHHWILDFNEYSFFVDYKRNRDQDRLKDLKRCLNYSNLSSRVSTVQSVRSEESVFIQLADVLTGMSSYRLNEKIRQDSAKEKVLNEYEEIINTKIKPTPKSENKFNVFKIDLAGGW